MHPAICKNCGWWDNDIVIGTNCPPMGTCNCDDSLEMRGPEHPLEGFGCRFWVLNKKLFPEGEKKKEEKPWQKQNTKDQQ